MNTKIKLGFKTEMMIISVVAFLTTLIGVSYAWLRSNIVTGSTSLFVGSAGLTLSYRGTSSVTNIDIAPGEKFEKTFEIENTGEITQTYNILWKNVTNTIEDKNYFMYTIENVDTGEQLFYPKYLPTNTTHIVYDISIPAGVTHSYKLTIYYVDDPKYNQLNNADLLFTGDITIDSALNERPDSEVLSIFVDGEHSDYLPTLSEHTIDTNRTFCTDGSSIAIVNGDIEISNKTSTTACELYLVSSTAPAVTHDPYNLLIVDLDGATGSIDEESRALYRYSGDIIELGVPEKTGYAFLGWEASGSGTTIIENTKVKMGNTYSYVKATWARGYWNRTVQTCSQGAPSQYTRKYKTCDQNLVSYNKTEKTCNVTSWTKTTSVCGITKVTKKTYKCSRTNNPVCLWSDTMGSYTSSTCSTNTPACTNGATQIMDCVFNYYEGTCLCSNEYEDYYTNYQGTACSKCSCVCAQSGAAAVANRALDRNYTVRYRTCNCTANYTYYYPSSATTTSSVAPSSCTQSTPACTSYSHYSNNNTKVTCGTPNTYGWTSSTSTTDSTCNATGSCSESTNGNSYVTNCVEKAWNFGDPTTTNNVATNACTPNNITCGSSTSGQTFRSCDPNYTYTLSTNETTESTDACSESSFTCNENTMNQEYTTSCTPTAYDYGYTPSTVQAGYCFADTSHGSCSSSATGTTYISECTLVEQ